MAFELWSYDDGQHYMGSWIALILLLFPTVIFNFSTFLLLSCSPKLTRSSSSLLVRILCLEDTVYALCCLLSCALNMHHKGIYGDSIGCSIQATYMLFFQLCTGYTLCCVAYNSERKVAGKRGLSQRQVWYTHIAIWLLAALITVLSTFIVQPARVYPSGTFCLVAINTLGAALLVWLPGLAVILIVITYRYGLLYRYIVNQSISIADQYAKTTVAATAQLRQIAAAKRMAAIVASFLLSNLPFAVVGLYELISGNDAPPIVTIGSAWLIHLGSMLNPIIYVWLNAKIRAALGDAVLRITTSAAAVSPLGAGKVGKEGGEFPSVTPPSDNTAESSPLTQKRRADVMPSPLSAITTLTTTTTTTTSSTQLTQTTASTSSSQHFVTVLSPSIAAAIATLPPPIISASEPLSPAAPRLQLREQRRGSSTLRLVVDGGLTLPGCSVVAVAEGVALLARDGGGSSSVWQQTAQPEVLGTAPSLMSGRADDLKRVAAVSM